MSTRMPFDVDHFIARNVQDAITASLAHHWLDRAEEFELARPRPGDFRGRASDEQIAAQDRAAQAKAEACRARAEVCGLSEAEESIVLDFVQVALVAARTAPGEVAA